MNDDLSKQNPEIDVTQRTTASIFLAFLFLISVNVTKPKKHQEVPQG
ncbi:MAG: hypothetical protein J6A30_04765 [Ruminococcus sp.]|nr:hypothetical protein [Ruminococcus sp.]